MMKFSSTNSCDMEISAMGLVSSALVIMSFFMLFVLKSCEYIRYSQVYVEVIL